MPGRSNMSPLKTYLEKFIIRALCLRDQPDWFVTSILRLCDWSSRRPAFRRWLLPPLLALWFSHLHLFVSAFFVFLIQSQGSFGSCNSIFMLSLVQPHHYYQNILAQGVGMGLGMGLIFIPSLTVTSHYFRVKRSIAMGFVIAGTNDNQVQGAHKLI